MDYTLGDSLRVAQGLGDSLQFDGDGDYVAITNSVDINVTTASQRTISLWFRADDTAIASRQQVLYEEGGSGRGLNIYLHAGRLYVGGWNIPT